MNKIKREWATVWANKDGTTHNVYNGPLQRAQVFFERVRYSHPSIKADKVGLTAWREWTGGEREYVVLDVRYK